MIWVDNAILALLAIYTLTGLMRGFSQVIYGLLVWFIGVLVACHFYQEFSLFLVKIASSPSTRNVLAFVALLLITLMLGWIINILSTESSSSVTFVNRIGGMILGFFQGLMVVFVLVLVAGITPLPKEHWWHESKYLLPFQSAALLVRGVLPANLQKSLNYR